MRKAIRLFALTLVLLLLSGCTSIAPKGKTLFLNESEEDGEDTPVISSDYELKRIVPVALDKIDPDGLHGDVRHAVSAWKDDERLLTMSIRMNTLSEDKLPEGTVEQQTERVLTQFATLNYEYGFFEPVLTLADVRAECYDVSADGESIACIVGNTLSVYSMSDGSLIGSVTRDVLAPRVTFAQDSDTLYFTSVGEQKRLEMLNVKNGVISTVVDEKSYRVLCGNSEGLLLTVVSQGTEEIGLYYGGLVYPALLSGKKSGSAVSLADGSALLVYGDTLYHVTTGGAQAQLSGISAFSYDEESGRIAYAQHNSDNTYDVYVGLCDQNGVANGRLVYKNVGFSVSTLLFSGDLSKLYVQGSDDQNAASALVIEFM